MRSIPTVTKNLLIINVLAFFSMLALKSTGIVDLNDLCGLHFFMASDFHLFQLITYMFMHANFEHILFNMFALWMFGNVVERVWGGRKFLFYYISCGLGAGLVQELFQFFWVYYTIHSQQPIALGDAFVVMSSLAGELNAMTTVGASGAIYGILLAFGLLFPEERIFIFPLPIPIKAKWFVIGYAVIELTSAFATPGDNVAHLAHLGGMLFGYLIIRYWRTHPGQGFEYSDSHHFFDTMRDKWEQRTHKRADEQPKRNAEDHSSDWDYNARKQVEQEKVDRILDKIRRSGYDSLTNEEKQTLFDQSNK